MNAILLYDVDTSLAALLEQRAGSVFAVENEADSRKVVDRLRREPSRYDAVVIGDRVSDPVRILQELAVIRQDVPSILLCEDSDVADLQRSMQFAPFLPTDLSIYLSQPPEAAADAISEAANLVRRRRRYGSIVNSTGMGSVIPPSEDHNLAFLSTLLEKASEAVVVIDQSGRSRQWNSRAESLFGGSTMLRHRSVSELVGEEIASALDDKMGSEAIFRLNTHDGTVVASVRLDRVAVGENVAGHILTIDPVEIGDHDDKQNRDLDSANRHLVDQAQELRRMNEALERSNRELEDFAYTASHDLQEPLRKINSFSDLLRADFAETLGGDGAFYLDRLQDAANRMIELIRGLLEYSRVATHAAPLRPTDLNVIVRRVLSDLEIAVEESHAQVDLHPLPTIEADPIQMRQLFQNLIGNAIKFRRDGVAPHIIICEEPDPPEHEAGMVSIAVADNGIGVESRFAERIFAPFQRLHNRNKFEGSGMGLAICRRIAQRHHGHIELTSEIEQGSTFRIKIPRYQPEEVA